MGQGWLGKTKSKQVIFYLFILLYSTSILKVCKTPGPTACLKMLNKVEIDLKGFRNL